MFVSTPAFFLDIEISGKINLLARRPPGALHDTGVWGSANGRSGVAFTSAL
jgi:hypothetical protein